MVKMHDSPPSLSSRAPIFPLSLKKKGRENSTQIFREFSGKTLKKGLTVYSRKISIQGLQVGPGKEVSR